MEKINHFFNAFKIPWRCATQGMDLWFWIIVSLLFLSAGLHFYAYQLQEQADFAGMLLFLFLGSWVNVISLASMAIISMVVFFRGKTVCP